MTALSTQSARRRWSARLLLVALAPTLSVVAASGSARALSQPILSLTNDGTGAQSTYTLRFTLGAALPAGGKIAALAPPGTDFTGCTATLNDTTDPAGSGPLDCGTGSDQNSLLLGVRTPVASGHAVAITVNGVRNPAQPQNGLLRVSTSSETTVTNSAPYNIVTRSVSTPLVSLSTTLPRATAIYTINFTTSPSGALFSSYSPSIRVAAPAGTDFRGCTADVTNVTNASQTSAADCNVTADQSTVVLGLRKPIDAGSQLRVQIGGVLNTGNPGQYTLDVSTSADRTPTTSQPYMLSGPAAPPPPATPTPAPSVSPTPSPGTSGPVSLSADRAVVQPGQGVVLTASGEEGRTVEILCYSQPSTTYVVVRRGALSGGVLSATVLPNTNSRCFGRYEGAEASSSDSLVITVRAGLSLTVVRNGVRNYTFKGRILPRRVGQLVTLYRVTDDGRRTATAQIKTDATGTYSITRQFTGSGRFGFLTRTGQTVENAPGESNTTPENVPSGRGTVRPTAVY